MANILWMDSKKCDGFSLEMYWKIHHKILCWKKKQSHIFVDICDGPEGLRDGFFLGKALANPSQNSWLRMAGILRMDLDFFCDGFLFGNELENPSQNSVLKENAQRHFCDGSQSQNSSRTFLWWTSVTNCDWFFLWKCLEKSITNSWLRTAGISLMDLGKIVVDFSLDMYFGNPSPKGWRAFFVSTKNLRDGFILGNKNKKIHHGVFLVRTAGILRLISENFAIDSCARNFLCYGLWTACHGCKILRWGRRRFCDGSPKIPWLVLKTNETTQISINNSLIFLVDNGKRSGMDMEILRCVLALKRSWKGMATRWAWKTISRGSRKLAIWCFCLCFRVAR